MIPFQYTDANKMTAAARIDHDRVMAIAGGTTMVDLMKLNVLTPEHLIHVRGMLPSEVNVAGEELTIGAACTMSDLADHDAVKGKLPVVRQSLILAASPQIRNMATIGGNLLQRTRSTYFRHTDMPVQHASGSAGADASSLAVLGNGGRLVGTYPGDFAIAFVAMGGRIELAGPDGKRAVLANEFYREPSDTFQYTTALREGELIRSLTLPITKCLRNSFYLKVRERSSYAFALASAAVGLDIQDDRIIDAKVGLGGLGSIPWHSREAEKVLIGNAPTNDVFAQAADAALVNADPPDGAQYKVTLARRTLARALQILRDRGPLDDRSLFAMQHGRN